MARRIVHQLVDDLDGSVLEVGEGETVLFSLDGTAYEIDLTPANAKALRAAFAPYVAAARSVRGSSGATHARGGRRASASPSRDLAPIRAWAAKNGYTVADRGRIPATVIEAYDAAN